MLSNRKGRKGKPAFAALAAATLAVGLFAGAGAAQAEPITIGDGTPCTFNGTSYPEGSEITDARGWKFICIAGEWVQIFDAVAVVDSGRTGLAPAASA